MPKYAFLYPLLFSLTLFGLGLELASPYLDVRCCCVFAHSDVEQEQEDYNGHTKPAKDDEDRYVSIFSSISLSVDLETSRRQTPDYSARALPNTFSSIFLPPPERRVASDLVQ